MISKTNAPRKSQDRKSQGLPEMPTTRGCYRNPCNQPGYGKLSDATCAAKGVPGLFTCTWCKGIQAAGGGAVLKNKQNKRNHIFIYFSSVRLY